MTIRMSSIPNFGTVNHGRAQPTAGLFLKTLAEWAQADAPTENRREARDRIFRAWLPSNEKLDLSGLQLTSLPDCLRYLPSPLVLHVDRKDLCRKIELPRHTSIETPVFVPASAGTRSHPARLEILQPGSERGSAVENSADLQVPSPVPEGNRRPSWTQTPPRFMMGPRRFVQTSLSDCPPYVDRVA